jgi:hypothetical protein
LRRSVVFLVAVALLVAVVSGTALAKGKPAGKGKLAQKKNPVVTYVFKGEVASVDGDSVVVSVEKGNKFARSYAGQQVDFAVNGTTRIVEDDAKTTLSDLDEGDRAVVKVRAPKSGAESFTARMVVAESPVAYYFDADGDGIGAGEAEYYFSGEEPEGYVSEGGDNCADVANPDQADDDDNGVGDACEPVI